MRLIDADALLKKAQALLTFDGAEVIWIHNVMVAPTIDPIRAAGGCRCGECRHHGAADGPMRQCDITDDNDFCSYGEPREEKKDGKENS